jgi:hypothetical protein
VIVIRRREPFPVRWRFSCVANSIEAGAAPPLEDLTSPPHRCRWDIGLPTRGIIMSDNTSHRSRISGPGIAHRERWPLVGVAAGITGFLATLIFDIHVGGDNAGGEAATMAVIDDVSQRSAHLSIIFGYTTVALLLILAATWRGAVERKLPESVAARIVTHGLTAAAGALSLGYGWKGAMSIYHPDGNEPDTYDQMGLYMYYILNDFGGYIGWLSVSVAAGAFAWMGLRERSIPLWMGIFSVLPVVAAWGWMIATGLPGFPGIVSPIWMVVVFSGLALHRGAIRAQEPASVASGNTYPAPAGVIAQGL